MYILIKIESAHKISPTKSWWLWLWYEQAGTCSLHNILLWLPFLVSSFYFLSSAHEKKITKICIFAMFTKCLRSNNIHKVIRFRSKAQSRQWRESLTIITLIHAERILFFFNLYHNRCKNKRVNHDVSTVNINLQIPYYTNTDELTTS